MENEIIYEISNVDIDVLNNHYGFVIGYYDDETSRNLLEDRILKFYQSNGNLTDIETVCQSVLNKNFEDVFVNESVHYFIANDEKEIDLTKPFDKWYIYNLKSTATLHNITGDVIQVDYRKKDSQDIAITEFRSYQRSQWGTYPLDVYEVIENITVRYFKKDGTYYDHVLEPKPLNEYERIQLDKKARSNIIESVREKASPWIQQKVGALVTAGTILPQDAQAYGYNLSINALGMLSNPILSTPINAFRNDRRTQPLLDALDIYPRDQWITDDLIDFIKDMVDVDSAFYTYVGDVKP